MICWQASSAFVKDWNRAVGIPWRNINCLAKSLLDSISAAEADGPKHPIPKIEIILLNFNL